MTKYYQDKDGKFALSTDFQDNQQHWSQKINNLGFVKVCQKDDVPTNVIKMNKYVIAKDFYNCVDKGVFLDYMKLR